MRCDVMEVMCVCVCVCTTKVAVCLASTQTPLTPGNACKNKKRTRRDIKGSPEDVDDDDDDDEDGSTSRRDERKPPFVVYIFRQTS